MGLGRTVLLLLLLFLVLIFGIWGAVEYGNIKSKLSELSDKIILTSSNSSLLLNLVISNNANLADRLDDIDSSHSDLMDEFVSAESIDDVAHKELKDLLNRWLVEGQPPCKYATGAYLGDTNLSEVSPHLNNIIDFDVWGYAHLSLYPGATGVFPSNITGPAPPFFVGNVLNRTRFIKHLSVPLHFIITQGWMLSISLLMILSSLFS